MDADGDFVVAWESYDQDGSSDGVFARRFSSAGTPLASEFRVNTTTTNNQRGASVRRTPTAASSSPGRAPLGTARGYGVFARRFSSAGAPLASEFQVNTYTAGDQIDPSVAADGEGHFVVAWQDSAQDGSGYGVFAQRFLTALITMDIDGNGAAEPLTDGLLVLRYLFGFRGATLITGAVGAGCTRCDAPAIEAYLAGLTGSVAGVRTYQPTGCQVVLVSWKSRIEYGLSVAASSQSVRRSKRTRLRLWTACRSISAASSIVAARAGADQDRVDVHVAGEVSRAARRAAR